MNTFPNYTFREAQLSDLMFYYDSLSSTELVLIDSFEFEINFKQKFEDVNYFMFVIEDLGKPVGLVVLQKVKNLSDPSPWVEILEFFILSKYRKLQAADYFYQKI
ncbi:MAG: GNAT family N-acetyltransferase, partial [Sediminibacterium sp.]